MRLPVNWNRLRSPFLPRRIAQVQERGMKIPTGKYLARSEEAKLEEDREKLLRDLGYYLQ